MPDDPRTSDATTESSDARRAMSRLTRRSFLTGGAAALALGGGLRWIATRPKEDGLTWPLRQTLQWNERLAERYFSESRLSPEFAAERAAEPRVNGRIGLRNPPRADWELKIVGQPDRRLPLAAIRALPRVEMVTELKCIEGWSIIVHWAGARLADFAAQYNLDGQYVGLTTPNGSYYVGLDRAAALHPQTLLCYEMNGQPLTEAHGAPLRLACAVKYGFKSLKRIGSIEFGARRPADYWVERGYDWYAGH